MISDQIEAAVQWQEKVSTQGQTAWEARHSAAVKIEIWEYSIISGTIYLTVHHHDDDHVELPIVHEWKEHERKCVAYLVNAVPGERSGTLRCQYRIEDHG